MRNVLLCASGSVAAIKVPEIVLELRKFANVKILVTTAGKYFLDRVRYYKPQLLEVVDASSIIVDDDEWNLWNLLGDPVLHIELRKWADIVLVAPCSADLLAKVTAGISDNLLLSVLRAVDVKLTPSIVCPAMNTVMWSHPATAAALDVLDSWGWHVIEPVVKVLACKDEGKGALAPVDVIVDKVREFVSSIDASVPVKPSNNLDEYLSRARKRQRNDLFKRQSANWGLYALVFLSGAVIAGFACNRLR
jgi:phosphopantothenoylcysteine decarboxylase